MEQLAEWTNTKAMMLNVGSSGGKYKNFANLKIKKLMSYLVLYLSHGIPPSPHFESKI